MATKKKIKPEPVASIAAEATDAALAAVSGDVAAAELAGAQAKVAEVITADRRRQVAWYRSNISILLNAAGFDTKECHCGCGQTIWMVPSKNGNTMPVSKDGLNHWADCPKAPKRKR